MSSVDRRSHEDTTWPDDAAQGPARDLTGISLGDFKIDKLLGRGGMGEVYLATQLSLSRPVALKVLRPNLASNPTYLSRLRSEATAVAKLNHPNIVHVYTFGCVDQVNFIAMEYVQGTNLKDYIYRKGALEIPLAFSIMRQTGQAIGAAGEVGLVHRDVKPENILMTKKGRIKIADFGLVRDSESDRLHITQSGVTMGTPLYMSPEQAQGHAIDHRSDLYSLGVTYYHMLTGEPPFHAETALAMAIKQVREAPRSMLILRPELPPQLDRIVLKLMEKDPVNRYQSAGLMLADLAKSRDSVQIGTTMTAIPDAYSADSSATAHDLTLTTPSGPVPVVKSDEWQRDTAVQPALTGEMFAPAWNGLARLRPAVLIATCAASLLVGAIPGYLARNPEVQTLAIGSAASLPALWFEPRWETIPKQNNPEEQFRYALTQAPTEDWVAAFLAVPGYFPHSHAVISQAYSQIARIWYRWGDVEALGMLETELPQWKDAQKRDHDLVDAVRIAINLKKNDWGAVVQGMKSLTRDDVPDTFDTALLELSMEICADAIAAGTRAGLASMRPALHACQAQLLKRLYRIELPNAGRPGALKKAIRGKRAIEVPTSG